MAAERMKLYVPTLVELLVLIDKVLADAEKVNTVVSIGVTPSALARV
jgi:hypothetical protein